MRTIIILALAFFMLSAKESAPPQCGKLIIEVDNIRTSAGMVWIGLYDSKDSYLIKEKAIVEGQVVYRTGKVYIEVPDLPFGNYALALFHDVNNNGELDQNFWGIPSEPYAFSRPPVTKWRIPRFDEVRFSFQNSNQVLITTLKKWQEY